MKNCCVPFCNSRPGGYEKISFHEFPSKLELRAAWVKAISREGEKHGSLWTPSDRSYICHKHFAASDYSVSTISRRILLPNSIPSIFPNYPAHILSKSSKKRKLSIPEKEIPSVNKRFPLNDPERLQKWLKALKRESWQPTKHSFLCSQHFTADSYKSSLKHFLKDDAVPTISCFSTDHPKIVRKRTYDHLLPADAIRLNIANDHLVPYQKPVVVLQRHVFSNQSSDLNCNPKPSLGSCQNDTLHKSRKTSSNRNSSFEASELEIYKDAVCDENFAASDDDFSDIDFSDSEDTKQRLDIMTAHYKKSQKKLKMCQQRCRLYKKEITALKEVIDSLRQINSVSDDN